MYEHARACAGQAELSVYESCNKSFHEAIPVQIERFSGWVGGGKQDEAIVTREEGGERKGSDLHLGLTRRLGSGFAVRTSQNGCARRSQKLTNVANQERNHGWA